jgi:pimeloyl-ACP methyl ester carboxylesterase
MNLPVRLDQFRQTFIAKSLSTGLATWSYFVAGTGPNALLVLPGAFGHVEMGFDYLTRLALDFRIIAVNYPAPISTIDGLLAGLTEILKAENIAEVDVIGASFGGLLAQCLARREPTCVRKLILSHTGSPDRARGRRNKIIFRIAALIPWPVLRYVLRKGMSKTARRFEADRGFWNSYLTSVVDTGIDRKMFISFCRRAVDLDLNFVFKPQDLPNAAERVLIVESDNDPVVKESSKYSLNSLYSGAPVHTFHGTGHLASLLQPAEYAEVVRDYLLSRAFGAR